MIKKKFLKFVLGTKDDKAQKKESEISAAKDRKIIKKEREISQIISTRFGRALERLGDR